jgi:hypothetical protein
MGTLRSGAGFQAARWGQQSGCRCATKATTDYRCDKYPVRSVVAAHAYGVLIEVEV